MKNKDFELVSVIITTYGRNYNDISNTIKSVFNQDYKNIELLIIDDNGVGSTIQKNIEKNINELQKNNNIVYYPNKVNSGAQISRNKGILYSHGKYLAFLDDDDEWEKNKISLQVELISNCDQIGLVYSKGWLINNNLSSKTPYNNSSNFLDTLSYNDLLYGDYIGTTSQVLIRREVFANVGLFDLNQPARQDYEMWIRISKKYICSGVNSYLFNHIIHKGEQISKNPIKAAIGIENIYKKYKYDMCLTAKWHISYLTFKAYKNSRRVIKTIRYFLVMCIHLFFTLILDLKEFKNRLKLHKQRTKNI